MAEKINNTKENKKSDKPKWAKSLKRILVGVVTGLTAVTFVKTTLALPDSDQLVPDIKMEGRAVELNVNTKNYTKRTIFNELNILPACVDGINIEVSNDFSDEYFSYFKEVVEYYNKVFSIANPKYKFNIYRPNQCDKRITIKVVDMHKTLKAYGICDSSYLTRFIRASNIQIKIGLNIPLIIDQHVFSEPKEAIEFVFMHEMFHALGGKDVDFDSSFDKNTVMCIGIDVPKLRPLDMRLIGVLYVEGDIIVVKQTVNKLISNPELCYDNRSYLPNWREGWLRDYTYHIP